MSKNVNEYKNKLVEVIEKINETQQEKIDNVASMMTETILNKKSIYAFGPSHAGMIVEEMVYRAGGLALVNPIHAAALLPNARPISITTLMERLPGYATVLIKSSGMKKGDFLLIHSVSARIPIVIEMAIQAKEMGVFVAGIVNMDFATKVTSLDSSGKMMYEVCDIVIDNCGELGDACISIPGLPQKVAPTSTVAGAFIVNSIVIKVCENLIKKDIEPPIFRSANTDGSNEFNLQLLEKYKDRIHYM